MSDHTFEEPMAPTEVTEENVRNALPNEHMMSSLIEMLNAIPPQSHKQDEEFESALEQIAYQKIKTYL